MHWLFIYVYVYVNDKNQRKLISIHEDMPIRFDTWSMSFGLP